MSSDNKTLARFVDWVIPAGETITRTLEGDAFHIRRTPGPVTVRLDNRGRLDLRSKTGFRLPCGQKFSKVEITNDNAFDCHVFAVACYGEYVEDGGEVGGASFGVDIKVLLSGGPPVKLCDYNEGRRALTIINGLSADIILGNSSAECAANSYPSIGSTSTGRTFEGFTGELWGRTTTAGGPFATGVEEIAEA